MWLNRHGPKILRKKIFFWVEMYENLLKDVWPNFDDKFGAKI